MVFLKGHRSCLLHGPEQQTQTSTSTFHVLLDVALNSPLLKRDDWILSVQVSGALAEVHQLASLKG